MLAYSPGPGSIRYRDGYRLTRQGSTVRLERLSDVLCGLATRGSHEAPRRNRMKVHRGLLLCSVLIVATLSSADTREEKEMSPLEFVEAYEAALATQEWDAVSPLIHERASVVFSNGTVHKGKDAVRQAYEKNFSAIKSEHYRMTNVHWLLNSPDTAVYMFDFSWTGIIDGKEASGGGRGTAVVVHENGRWQLLAEHLGYPEH